jgi:hypothetical protein
MPVTPSKRPTRVGTRTAWVRAALVCILVTGATSGRAQSPATGTVADLELGRNKAVTLCAACHKPLPQDSDLFTLKPLREAAAR